jgi:hypothetical protein
MNIIFPAQVVYYIGKNEICCSFSNFFWRHDKPPVGNILTKCVTALKTAARRVGRFQTAVILAVTYFFILCPVGLFMRLFGRDPLEAAAGKHDKPSNWKKTAEDKAPLRSLRRQS